MEKPGFPALRRAPVELETKARSQKPGFLRPPEGGTPAKTIDGFRGSTETDALNGHP
jgi:hypothetical protein